MIETMYEFMLLLDRVTGVVAAMFALGLALGYMRVIASDSKLVRDIAISIVLFAAASATETLRVRTNASASIQLLGVLFNLLVFFAAYRGLLAQHRMIPESERQQWHWYSAPMYPPWVTMKGVQRFVARWRDAIRQMRFDENHVDRRQQDVDIDFPDRRGRE